MATVKFKGIHKTLRFNDSAIRNEVSVRGSNEQKICGFFNSFKIPKRFRVDTYLLFYSQIKKDPQNCEVERHRAQHS